VQIAILLYDRLTALDAIGQYEVLSRLPGAEVVFVAADAGPQRTDTGRLGLLADRALADIEYDPQPPYAAGSPDRAPAQIVAALRARSRFVTEGERAG
jgi:putative intracellular protease/amidase